MSKQSTDEEFEEFMNKKVYDWACKCSKILGKTDKTTINNLVEVFKGDPVEAYHLLLLYIVRETNRDEIDIQLAKQLVSDIHYIYKKFNNNKQYLEEAIRKYLVLFKWVFESVVKNKRLAGADFEEFVTNFEGA